MHAIAPASIFVTPVTSFDAHKKLQPRDHWRHSGGGVWKRRAHGKVWFGLMSYRVLNSLPWLVKLTAFIQNIVLLFFALLAIRNYFKLG